MIYIFEGGDLSGKTSVALAFAAKHNLPVLKKRFEVLKDGNTREFLNSNNIEAIQKFFWLTVFPLRKSCNFVIDRALLSSLVYGRFFNREFDKEYIYEALRDQDVQVFWVTANEESIKRRKDTRDEKLFSLEEILKLQTMYREVSDTLANSNIYVLEVENNDGTEISQTLEGMDNFLKVKGFDL